MPSDGRRAVRECPIVDGRIARVHLGKAFWMTIDAEDLDRVVSVSSWRWSESRREVNRVSRNRTIIFTRWLLDPADGVWVDHRNGNRLDNRRENLRLATPSENCRNSAMCRRTTRSSQFKGVFWIARLSKWSAQIRVGKRHLGVFLSEIDAALAYDVAARAHFGEFACVNFPRPGERSALVPVVAPVPS